MTGKWVFAAIVAAGFGLSGCSSAPSLFGSSNQPVETPAPAPTGPTVNNPGASPMHNRIFGAPAQVAPVAAMRDDICPPTDVRDGTAVHRIADASDPSPLGVRYQATIVDTARECRVEDNNLVIKVGVEGRVVVGPKGGAGRITLPIRIAVVKGLTESLWTRLYTVTIDVPQGSPNVTFTQVEENLTLPLPPEADLARYRIFIGFDAAGAKADRPGGGRRN